MRHLVASGHIFTLLLLLNIVSASFFFAEEKNKQADDDDLLLLPLHPNSPPESDPAVSRAKRQAFQVYSGNEASVSADRQPESGPWGPWTPERECSRSCGGGVQVERRACSGSDCVGSAVRYLSCNTGPCPEGAVDYRAEQCASFNDSPLDGKYFKWIPYAGKNKCELTCKPETANFYYKWADKVTDGTKCDNFGEEICVDGFCLPVGCDGKLGSEAKNDKCGICDGDGSKCKSEEGVFDERNLSPGYHDIVVIPVGATTVKVEEIKPTSNSLAIKNSTGHFYLNGDFKINLLDKNVRVAGTTFKYRKSNEEGQTEQLTANGPLKEAITIALLLQRGGQRGNSIIKYEFSIPLESNVTHLYRYADWSGCSVTCGQGDQKRDVFCVEQATNQRVEEEKCEELNATKPEFEKKCSTVDCDAEWFTGDWETCSESCGQSGLQFRVVYCHKVYADGRRMTIPDENCTESGLERPEPHQSCNRFSCPELQYGPWSACSQQCGDAKQYRSVTCRSAKEGEEGKLLAAEACPSQEQQSAERDCNLGPCEGLKFNTGDWQLCQRCNDTEEIRNVTCEDKNGRKYPLEKCLTGNVTSLPVDTRPCATEAPCLYEWHSSQWSKCSTECGHGHRKRRVFCAIAEVGEVKPVEDGLCSVEEKPTDKDECVNEEKCTGTYFTGPWTECTEKCGGGQQSRVIVCLNYDKKPVPEWCDEKDRPDEEQECNVDPCPTCGTSEFGCCLDNSTFAKGPEMEGCSNCSLAEFGCCTDNVTEATGADGLGCPEFVEGSGEEPEDATTEKLCEVKNEATGDILQIPCSATIAPALVAGDEEVEALLEGDNVTAENVTVHCSKTKFGCCPDWDTAAEGKSLEGCPVYVLGTCNGTKFGCCLDEVTLARGPNLEGCGEANCAASLYGCCKDRKTIAFGPHYAGCERSSFPCEISQFGCCPDGETAALGQNATGCGASCLITKFGCCPDGLTQAKGPSNEGCGCEFAQFGCCPDGKSPANGPGYYGCPESCAQSKHGCCPDGKSTARGPNKEGCPCQYTRWGCCPDGETTALGPLNEGCDDCRYAKFGCCLGGTMKATGPDYAGCPSTTPPPFIVVACGLPQDQGYVCHPGYKLVWFYDAHEGRCSQFWFGGCGGNENRFASLEQCEQVCFEPPQLGRCYLPKIEGPQRCNQLEARYWYDYNTKQCSAFWWRGCLGNANNFPTFADCVRFCAPADAGQVAPGIRHAALQPTQYIRPPPPPPAIYRPAQYVEQQPPQQQQQHQQQAPIVLPPQQHHQQQSIEQPEPVANVRTTEVHGCGGNNNRFDSLAECLGMCVSSGGQRQQQATQPPYYPHPPPPVTTVPPPGVVPIRHYPPMEPSRRIQTITMISRGRPPTNTKTRDVCNLRNDVGKCEGHFESWYYEVASGSCEKFQYSGCGGNGNRFHNREQCEELCMREAPSPRQLMESAAAQYITVPGGGAAELPFKTGVNSNLALACEAPKDSGTCKRFVTKWYFSKQDGTCNRFHYGGCDGNGNRFETEQECKNTCGEYIDACSLPLVTGPCAGKNERFYFDYVTRECKLFEYSGCLGNANNFRTHQDCKAKCPCRE